MHAHADLQQITGSFPVWNVDDLHKDIISTTKPKSTDAVFVK